MREDNRLVLQSLLMGMSNLNIPEAGKQLLEGLTTRVEFHVADPGLTAMPEVQALENMCSRIARTLGGNAPECPDP
ncbi:MAG: hypothetical protein HC898_05150 [Phycisphaerales bacterium]|nr:hypothetical protein [Phycisphaerales bacterium]